VWRIVIRYASPAPAACKGGSVQPAVMVHEASVPRAGELSNFTTGEWVSISTGHGTGSVGGAAGGCKNI
jgi:hypothetical protein